MRKGLLHRRRMMQASGVEFLEYLIAGNGQGFTSDWQPPLKAGIEFDILRTSEISQSTKYTNFCYCEDTDTWAEFSVNNGGAVGQANSFYFWNNKTYGHGGAIHIRNSTDLNNSRGILAMNFNSYRIAANTYTMPTRSLPNRNHLEILKINGGAYNIFNMRIYSIKLTNDGVTEREYLPAIDGGRVGFYETQSGKMQFSDTGVEFEAPSI